jgi:DnaJ-class molecular chaperone
MTWSPPRVAMKPCATCAGQGTLPRQQRRFPPVTEGGTGDLDPSDFVGKLCRQLCTSCGGSGEVPEKAVTIEARKGFAADLITTLAPPIWA